MRLATALALTLIAFPASAQVSRCGWELGQWVCRTERPPAAPPPYVSTQSYEDARRAGYDSMARFNADRERSMRAADERRAAEAAQMNVVQPDLAEVGFRNSLAAMVRDGKCDEAKTYALNRGDMDAAEQAMRLCVPK